MTSGVGAQHVERGIDLDVVSSGQDTLGLFDEHATGEGQLQLCAGGPRLTNRALLQQPDRGDVGQCPGQRQVRIAELAGVVAQQVEGTDDVAAHIVVAG